MRIAVVVPHFNEARRIDPAGYLVADQESISWILVDDGSTDATYQSLESLAKSLVEKGFTAELIRLPRNCGKGEAVRAGMQRARLHDVDYCGFLDADFSAPVSSLVKLAHAARVNRAAVVFGSRVALESRDIRRSAMRHYIGRIAATLVSITLNLKLYDTQAGAKVFATDSVARLFDEPFVSRWLFDCEIVMRAREMSLEIVEEPLDTWHERPEDSKFGLRAYGQCLVELARIRWSIGRGRDR